MNVIKQKTISLMQQMNGIPDDIAAEVVYYPFHQCPRLNSLRLIPCGFLLSGTFFLPLGTADTRTRYCWRRSCSANNICFAFKFPIVYEILFLQKSWCAVSRIIFSSFSAKASILKFCRVKVNNSVVHEEKSLFYVFIPVKTSRKSNLLSLILNHKGTLSSRFIRKLILQNSGYINHWCACQHFASMLERILQPFKASFPDLVLYLYSKMRVQSQYSIAPTIIS